MMRKFLLLTVLISTVVACEKENLLEDTELQNASDGAQPSYLEVDKVTVLACSVIVMDLKVDSAALPVSIDYTHYLIKKPNGESRKVSSPNQIYIRLDCARPTALRITLYNENTGRESIPLNYTYVP
jgi:hypothetical protein